MLDALLLDKRPPWAFAGADLDLDFANGRGWVAPGRNALRDFLTVTRASVGYAEYDSGVWLPSASGVARISNKGLLVEEARTNSIRNNSMQGAVAGTPGTLPTNWALTNAAGITASVVGTGTENGIDYLDYRVSGTSDGDGGLITIFFETTTGAAALSGQTWTISLFLKLVSGSLAGLTAGPRIQAWETTSGGVFVTATTASANLTVDGTFSRFTHTTTLSGGGTVAYIRPYITMSLPASTAFDFTLRIGWPQLELGAFVTSPIRTTTAAATRAVDVVALTDPSIIPGGEGSLFAEAVSDVASAWSGTAVFWGWSDAQPFAGNNHQYLSATVSTLALGAANVVAGTGDFAGGVGTLADGVVSKVAIGLATNNSRFSADGALGALDTSVSPATGPAGYVRFGSAPWGSGGGNNLNGYLRRVAYYPTRLTDAQLQALTT